MVFLARSSLESLLASRLSRSRIYAILYLDFKGTIDSSKNSYSQVASFLVFIVAGLGVGTKRIYCGLLFRESCNCRSRRFIHASNIWEKFERICAQRLEIFLAAGNIPLVLRYSSEWKNGNTRNINLLSSHVWESFDLCIISWRRSYFHNQAMGESTRKNCFKIFRSPSVGTAKCNKLRWAQTALPNEPLQVLAAIVVWSLERLGKCAIIFLDREGYWSGGWIFLSIIALNCFSAWFLLHYLLHCDPDQNC